MTTFDMMNIGSSAFLGFFVVLEILISISRWNFLGRTARIISVTGITATTLGSLYLGLCGIGMMSMPNEPPAFVDYTAQLLIGLL